MNAISRPMIRMTIDSSISVNPSGRPRRGARRRRRATASSKTVVPIGRLGLGRMGVRRLSRNGLGGRIDLPRLSLEPRGREVRQVLLLDQAVTIAQVLRREPTPRGYAPVGGVWEREP